MTARVIITVWTTIRVGRLGSVSARTPGEQPEDHDRDELGGGDDPEPDRIVRQLEDEPGLGDLLHPRADERDRLAAEEQPVVAMAEGGDAAARPITGGRALRRRRGADRARRSRRGCVAARAARVLDHRADAVGLGVEQADLPLDPGQGLVEVECGARPGRSVCARRSRLRSRAASSSSIWPTWASEKPASSRRLLMKRRRSRSRRVEEAVVAVGSGGRLQQPELLVVADRAGGQADLGGDLLDAEEAGLGRRGRGRWVDIRRPSYHNLHVHVKVRVARSAG